MQNFQLINKRFNQISLSQKFCEKIFDEQTHCKRFFAFFSHSLLISEISSLFLAFDFVKEGERENYVEVQNVFYGQSPEALVYNFHLTKMPMFIFCFN